MAGTRRTVERLGALLVSVTISMLVFRPLMVGKHSLVGFRGDDGDSASVAVVSLESRIDSLVAEVLSAPIDPVIEIKEADDPPAPGASPDSFASQHDDVPVADYLPASMLTQRPIVLLDIHPELPASLQDVEPQSVDLLLLINIYGDVDQVLLESLPTLSTSMVQELRQHFQVMRFMPGQWQGQAVPSALRIRVKLHP
jgi:hypothetical protein